MSSRVFTALLRSAAPRPPPHNANLLVAPAVGAAVTSGGSSGGGSGSGSLLRPTRPLFERSKRYKHLNPLTPDNATNPLSKPTEINKSALHVVASPLGNVKDFTIRALEVLRQVDYIVCTNRNATKALLNIIDIDFAGRLIQLSHAQPKAASAAEARSRALALSSSDASGGSSSSSQASSSSDLGIGVSHQRIVDMLRGGRSVALVTPAGTPCVGDSGTELVKACILNGVRVTAVPGACSVTAALSISGANIQNDSMLATSSAISAVTSGGNGSGFGAALAALQRLQQPVGQTAFGEGSFFFGGYLSERSGPRARQIRQIRDFSCPSVFFEVPRRLPATLTDMAAILDRRVGDSTRNVASSDEMMIEADEGDDFEYDDDAENNGKSSSSASASAVLAAANNLRRDRSRRAPRRVTILHEMTKFNESSHSGSSTALLRFYSQMGRATMLTELGQLMIVVDGVSTKDLVGEDAAQQTQLQKGSAADVVSAASSSSTAANKNDDGRSGSSSFFRSSVFGGGGSVSKQQPSSSSSSSSSKASNAGASDSSAAAKKLRRQERLRRVRQRLIEKIKAKQAAIDARAMVSREAMRRHREGPEGPTPLP